MKNKSIRHVMILAAVSLLVGFCLPAQAGPSTVDAGYDLFTTVPSGTFYDPPGLDLGELQGVPLDTYNFGNGQGPLNVGSTDTIVQRLAPNITVPGTFNLFVDALQLQSVFTIPALGNQYAFITLDNSVPGGSSGTMHISANGTFTSTLDIYFDVYAGTSFAEAMNTTPVATDLEETFINTGSAWSHTAPPGALQIPGINDDLNGPGDTSADFWPTTVIETAPNEQQEVVPTTAIPDEPSALALLLMPLGIFALAAAHGKVARRA
jgi:hypothetical protein